MKLFTKHRSISAKAPVTRDDPGDGRLPEGEVKAYLARIGQFTNLLPSIMEAIGRLSQADDAHLTGIQDFQEKLAEIFQGQEEIAGHSAMVLETGQDYGRLIQEAGGVLRSLIGSFEESLFQNQKLSESLARLSDRSRQLQELASLMSEMSLTISQVSRNAEIKAYHAGSAGRGFAVIAENMNKLSLELMESASQAPRLDSAIRESIEGIELGLSQSKDMAEELKVRSQAMERDLSEISQDNALILSGFQEMKQLSASQSAIREQLLSGMANITEITANLGISQEVVASVLNTEMASVGQIDFLREQAEQAQNLWGERPGPAVLRELMIKLRHLQFELTSSVGRWQGLEGAIGSLKGSALQEERLSSDTWSRLKQLFGSIDGIGQQVRQIGDRVGKVLSRTEDLRANLISGRNNLVLLKQLQDGMQQDCQEISRDLDQLKEVGRGIGSFSEQVKLLAFYSAVEITEMGQWGKELQPIVDQTRSLAIQAGGDSTKIQPILEELDREFRQTMEALSLGRSLATANLDQIGRADFSLNIFINEAEKISRIGQAARTGIDSQEAGRRDLMEVYSRYSQSFRAVTGELDTIQKLFLQAHQTLSGFGQESARILGQLDDRVVQRNPGGLLKLALPSEPLTLDPALRTDATSNEVVAQLYEGLVQFDAGVNLIPGIATHWNISGDGREWTFFLRKKVKFHNGRELTAEDVKYSLERLLDPAINSPNAYFVDMIEGAADMQSGRSSSVKGIRVLDRYSLRITLQSAYMPFLANLAATVTAIVPREEAIRPDRSLSANPVGCGPFRLKQWVPGQRLDLERFDDYYSPRVSLQGVSFVFNPPPEARIGMLSSGELDQLEIRGRERQEMHVANRCRLEKLEALNIQYICINVNLATPFVDKRVRQALNLCIDKVGMIESSSLKEEAIVARGVFPPGLAAYNQSLEGYSYDPGRAAALLSQAGYSQGLPGEYLLDIRDNQDQRDRAELIINDCRKVGVNLKANPLAWKDLLERSYQGQAILSVRGWSSDNGDPDNFLYPLFHSRNWGRPGNTSYFKSARIDEMLVRALAIRNPLERLNFYREIEKLVVEEAPWVFLYHSLKFVATNDYVHGYRIRPMGAARLKDCWVEPREP